MKKGNTGSLWTAVVVAMIAATALRVCAQPPVPLSANEVTSQALEGFQVTVASEHYIYSAGDPVRVDVRLRNMTDQSRQMPYPDQPETY